MRNFKTLKNWCNNFSGENDRNLDQTWSTLDCPIHLFEVNCTVKPNKPDLPVGTRGDSRRACSFRIHEHWANPSRFPSTRYRRSPRWSTAEVVSLGTPLSELWEVLATEETTNLMRLVKFIQNLKTNLFVEKFRLSIIVLCKFAFKNLLFTINTF